MKNYKVAMVITDSFHSDIEGKNYKFGTPNKLNKTSKPLILFYFVQDYKRTWDEANPLNYDDPQLKNDAIVTKIESEGDVLNISLFDYESLDETELRFEVGKETSISKVVDENDHTKEYKFIPTKIVVADSLEKGSKVYDELIETVWTNYYIKNSKEGEKIPKVAENVENLAAEGHSHNKSSYKKCAECSDSVFELEEEICFECSSFGAETNMWEADYTKGYTDTTQKIEYEDNYGKPKEVIVQGLSGYAGNCPSCSKRINFPIDSSGLYCYDCQVYLRPSKGTGMDKTLQYDAETFNADRRCIICKGSTTYGEAIGDEESEFCGNCNVLILPNDSDRFKVSCSRCGFGDPYFSTEPPCEICEPIAEQIETLNVGKGKGAETFEDCEVCYATVDKGTLNDVQAGRICNECHKMNQYDAETFESEWVVEAVQQNLNDKDFVNYAYKVLIGGDAKTFEEKSMAIAETMNQNANNDDFTSFVESELFYAESFEANTSHYRLSQVGKMPNYRKNKKKTHPYVIDGKRRLMTWKENAREIKKEYDDEDWRDADKQIDYLNGIHEYLEDCTDEEFEDWFIDIDRPDMSQFAFDYKNVFGNATDRDERMNYFEGYINNLREGQQNMFPESFYDAETFEANAKTGNKVYIITRRCEDYSAYRELDVAGFGSLTEARKKFNILFKEAKKQDYADYTIADAKYYMSWGEYWGIMSFNDGEMIYELREVIVGDKGDFYFDAEGEINE